MLKIKRRNRDSRQDIIESYFLFLLSIIVIYKLPSIAGSLFQVILLIFFWLSKKDYFRLAFVFIVEANPGGLFFIGDPNNTFSIVQNSPLGNLYFWIMFTLMAYLKVGNRKPQYSFFLKTNFSLLFAYLGLLFITFGVYRLAPVFRMLLPWLYLFILPRTLKSMDDYAGFFRLIMAFVPFVILTQVYSIVFGGTVGTALGGTSNEAIRYLSIEETSLALRPVDGILIPFLAILGSLIYLISPTPYFKRSYLTTIMALSILSIYITATRSWMLASLLIFVGYLLVVSKNPLKTLFRYCKPALVIFIVALQIRNYKNKCNWPGNAIKQLNIWLKGTLRLKEHYSVSMCGLPGLCNVSGKIRLPVGVLEARQRNMQTGM